MVKFLVFSDYHYDKAISAINLDSLDEILKRGYDEKVDFVIQCGDFCTNYSNSPELPKAYLKNKYNLPVYGIYGNHEMEFSTENTMELITPTLCNRKVNWGKDGEAYWYFDIKNFRIIGLDTNYSFNPQSQSTEHNIPGSYGPRIGNTNVASVSPDEFIWLDNVLNDAKVKGMKAIVFSHHTMIREWYDYNNNPQHMLELYKKYSGTLLMSVNGDTHTDHFIIKDNIAFFCVNTVFQGSWITDKAAPNPYPSHAAFTYYEYDKNGNRISKGQKLYSEVRKYLMYTKPLSAVVTIHEDGNIIIDGTTAEWLYGILPEKLNVGQKSRITSHKAKVTV